MLRFDIPAVCSHAYRFQAGMNFTIAAIYLFTPWKWVAFILAIGGLIRGFVSPHRCVSYRLFEKITAHVGWIKKVNAGSKMFADKVACFAGSIMAVSWLAGTSIGNIPALAVLVFAFLDLTIGFCAACWVYSAWYRIRGSA